MNESDELDLSNEVSPAELARMSMRSPVVSTPKPSVARVVSAYTNETGLIGWLINRRIVRSSESAVRLLIILSVVLFILAGIAYVAILNIGTPQIDTQKARESIQRINLKIKIRALQR